MQCRIVDLRCKEVINISSGFRMGYICDVLLDTGTGKLTAIVIPGPYKFFGLFGREDDYIVPWEDIRRIGDDIVLVEVSGEHRRQKRQRHIWF